MDITLQKENLALSYLPKHTFETFMAVQSVKFGAVLHSEYNYVLSALR